MGVICCGCVRVGVLSLYLVSLTGWSPWGSCMCGGFGFCSPVFRLSLVGCCVLRVLVSLVWVVLLAGWLLALGRGGLGGGKNCVLPVEGCWVPGSQLCPPSRWGLLLELLAVCFRGFPCQELPTRQTLSVVVMGLPERMEVLTVATIVKSSLSCSRVFYPAVIGWVWCGCWLPWETREKHYRYWSACVTSHCSRNMLET